MRNFDRNQIAWLTCSADCNWLKLAHISVLPVHEQYLLKMSVIGVKPLNDVTVNRLTVAVPALVAAPGAVAPAGAPAPTVNSWEFNLHDPRHRPALLKALFNLREKLLTI
jgi:hypothetical protein